MFEHPGGKIRTWAQVLWLVDVIALVLVGAFVFAAGVRSGDFGQFLLIILSGAVAIAFLVLSAFLSVLFMYSFGELVEETTQQSALLERNNELLEKLVKSMGTAPAAAPIREIASAKEAAPAVEAPIGSGRVKCPHCGTIQSAERDKCYNCGAALK